MSKIRRATCRSVCGPVFCGFRPPVTTVPQYRAELVSRLGTQALNRRLSDKASAGGTSYRSARVGLSNDSNAVYTAELGRSADADGAAFWSARLD